MNNLHNHYHLEKLPLNQLVDLAKFVVIENFKHHTNGAKPLEYENEIKCIFRQELNYFENAQIFVFKDINNAIVGSIRVLKWNYIDILPIQRIFNMIPSVFCKDDFMKSVWHIGRFAISKGINDISMFKHLMLCAIAPICEDENSVVFAECDSKLLRVLGVLGINAKPIGEPIYYLGSETIPIKMSYSGLINFFRRNQGLAQIRSLNLNSNKPENYTFG